MNLPLTDSGRSPLMNAAGTVKTVDQVRALVGAPVAAILAGSFTLEERDGNSGRTFFEGPTASLNSMGLPSPALDTWVRRVNQMAALCAPAGHQLWVSVAGFSPAEYRILSDAALGAGADFVELNLGCPNVWHDGGQKPIVSFSADETRRVLDELSGFLPLDRVGVKLSPILDPVLLAAVDAVLGDAGLAFVTTMNTVPNCFAYDDHGVSAIGFGSGLGGMSGPASKWIGLGQVKAHRSRLPDTPIIGVGGITNGEDLSHYLDAAVGADLCQVGTAFWQRGGRVIAEILADYADLLPHAVA